MHSFFLIILTLGSGTDRTQAFWPGWRGPNGTGAVAVGTPPTQWNEKENVTWKKELPGFGLATPIIWGDHIYLLTAVKTERKAEKLIEVSEGKAWARPIVPTVYQSFDVMALNRKDGSIIWQKTASEQLPHEAIHGDSSWASNSPATDGTCLIASFGSVGIYCYEMDGNLRWSLDLGDMETRGSFGEGSSPLIWKDTVVINWDHEGESFIIALDKKTGKTQWRVARDERTSWSTPMIAEIDGKVQVIVSATNKVRAYDIADGTEIWNCGGMTVNAIPSPIVSGTHLYVASGFRGNAVLSLDLAGASGDLSGSKKVRWQLDRDAPYVPSILLQGDGLYFTKHNKGVITRVDSATGKVDYGPQRLDGINGLYASPVAVGGHIYIVGREGTTVVLKDSKTFEVVSTNPLDDKFDASPAIAGDALYLRGHKALYCIGKP